MISQLQNIQAFVTRDLAGVIDWGRDVRLDDDRDRKTTGDQAYVVIKTPFNSYRMGVLSAYIEPPGGAPVTCKSLGTVTFDDPAAEKYIVGPKAENTFGEIAKHISARELADALADARRKAAEASAADASAARMRLAEIAARARMVGVKVRDDDLRGPTVVATPEALDRMLEEPQPSYVIAPANPVIYTTAPSPTSAHADDLYVGCPVVFITNPGEAIGGMHEIPGFVSKLLPGGRISMFLMPDNSEVCFRDNLPRRGSDAGNGNVHRYNCWDLQPEHQRLLARIRHLEEAIEKTADEGNADRVEIAEGDARIAALEAALSAANARLDALEAKPKRGRPPKSLTAEVDDYGRTIADGSPESDAE